MRLLTDQDVYAATVQFLHGMEELQGALVVIEPGRHRMRRASGGGPGPNT